MISEVVALILTLMGPVRDPRLAAELAPIISREARAQNLDPMLVTSVMAGESSFRKDAIGDKGELGLMQIFPHGEATIVCRRLLPRIRRTTENIRCGCRILARARARCGPEELRWLGAYAGFSCRRTSYAARVIGRIEAGGRKVAVQP